MGAGRMDEDQSVEQAVAAPVEGSTVEGATVADGTSAQRGTAPAWTEAAIALGIGFFVLVVLGFDAKYLGAGKHEICDKWLAKGYQDCAGSDGFRQWAPRAVREGLILFGLELVLVPLLVLGAAHVVRSLLSQRRGPASH